MEAEPEHAGNSDAGVIPPVGRLVDLVSKVCAAVYAEDPAMTWMMASQIAVDLHGVQGALPR